MKLSIEKPIPAATSRCVSDERIPYSDTFSLRNHFKCDVSSVQTSGSEEISDQDVACRRDMEKMADNLNCHKDNSALLNISEFSIEPSSNPSEDVEVPEICKDVLTTTSINENSSNAVDNNISAASYCSEDIQRSDLSFNGKIPSVVRDNAERIDFVNHEIEVGMETEVKTKTPDKELVVEATCTRSPKFKYQQSPDMFADDSEEEEEKDAAQASDSRDSIGSFSMISQVQNTSGPEDAKPSIEKIEKSAMNNLQNLLAGVYPPPSVTIIEHDINNLLSRFEANKSLMDSYLNQSVSTDHEYSFKGNSRGSSGYWSISSDDDAKTMDFNAAMETKNYGISYNRTDYSERIEAMHMKLAERLVGQETSSSFTYFWPSNGSKQASRKG